MAKEPRTAFISYARRGGSEAAERLRDLLAANDIRAWQDRTHLRGGDDFWQQIEQSIKRCSYLVMVVTPDAFDEERRILRREWYTARNAGTCVIPVKGVRDMDLDDALPRWLKSRHVIDLDQPKEMRTMIEQLQGECKVERVPFMVEDLPVNYTPRSKLNDDLLTRLLSGAEPRVGVTAALRGAGGFGKTVLARSICHDDRVIAAFEHGILWMTLGEQPRVLDKLSILYAAITGEPRTFSDPDVARGELAETLRFKRCLIVIDDVWNYDDLEPFLLWGRESARLITTRQASIVAQAHAIEVSVNAMTTEEAVSMMTADLPEMGRARSALADVAQRLGEWPVLLNLFTGHVRESIQYGQDAIDALKDLLMELDQVGATAFDRATAKDRTQAIDLTLGVSLKRLSQAEKDRCFELAVFPEDVAIPVTVVGDLWHTTDVDTRRNLRRFADLGLITLDLARRSIGVHDVVRDYFSRRLARSQAEVHASLVDAWPDLTRPPHDYAWRWLAHHLAKANREEKLRQLLTNSAWLTARLARHGLAALIDDFEYLGERDTVRLVQYALEMDARALFANPSLLPTQLLGRLRHGTSPEIDRLIKSTIEGTSGPWLRPLDGAIHPPGGALARVLRGYAAGHEGTVRSIAMDPHGRWAITAGNSSQDQAVIIWNLRSGSLRRLPGQARAGGYTPLAIAGDGTTAFIASGTEVRLVGTTEGNEIASHFTGDAIVTAVALSNDGTIGIWGTADGLVSAWAFADGSPFILGRHTGRVDAIDIAQGARVFASADEDEVRLWDLEKRNLIANVTGAAFGSRCFTMTNDRCVLWAGPSFIERNPNGSISSGEVVLKSWIPPSPTIRISHQPEISTFFAVSRDGRRALASRWQDWSEALVLCEFGTSHTLVALQKMERGVSTAVISGDGRWAATGDFEHDLFVWNLDRAVSPMPQHAAAAWHDMPFLGFSTCGRFAVFRTSDLTTVVDTESGNIVRDVRHPEIWQDQTQPRSVPAPNAFQGNDYPVDDFGRSRGHTATVNDVRTAPNGRWEATVSHDGSVRVWDLKSESALACFSSELPFIKCHWSPDSRTLAVIEAVTHSEERTHLLRLEAL
jgi:WD40 repeat protein